ncbi:MAG TPA: hypothetical protein VKT81_14150, partial [Bryobacteraceae bacterium]|nr:hypothetical protein [Bryobacteraceae bacterium]
MIRVALFLSALLAGTLSAQVSTSTVTLTVDPTQTLSDLYFLYAQGDISRAFPLMGDAPANTSTQFDISAITADLPFPVSGTPFFSLVGVYDATAGGVAVAIEPGQAASLISIGATFDQAFYSFADPSGNPLGESSLAFAMENPNQFIDGFTGSELVQIFADTPEQQFLTLFPLCNASGTTTAPLLNFSDATAGGSLSITVATTGSVATPEPATGWMLAVFVSSLAGVRARNSQKSKRTKS